MAAARVTLKVICGFVQLLCKKQNAHTHTHAHTPKGCQTYNFKKLESWFCDIYFQSVLTFSNKGGDTVWPTNTETVFVMHAHKAPTRTGSVQ